MKRIQFTRATNSILGAALLLGVIAFLRASPCTGIQPSTSVGACYQAAYMARAYYASIIREDYADAFQQVATFTAYPDQPLEIPYAIQEERWVNRLRKAKEDGIYIAEVRDVEVWTDDAAPMGRATVVIVMDGVEHLVAQNIYFIQRERWQVNTIRSEGNFGRVDEAISGGLSKFCAYPPNCSWQ